MRISLKASLTFSHSFGEINLPSSQPTLLSRRQGVTDVGASPRGCPVFYVGNNRAGRPRPYTNRAPTRDAPTGNMNHLGQAQGFKPRIARIAQIILGQHDETDDTDFASKLI